MAGSTYTEYIVPATAFRPAALNTVAVEVHQAGVADPDLVFDLAMFTYRPEYLMCPPSCTDGMWNGQELGIDCGGPCVRGCNDPLPPCENYIQDVAFATYVDRVDELDAMMEEREAAEEQNEE